MSFWNDLKKTVKEGFTVATEKTEEYTKIAKVKVDILSRKKDLDKAFRDLGELVYDSASSGKKMDPAQDKDAKALMDTIRTCKQDIKGKEAEIEAIKKEAEFRAQKQSEPADKPKAEKESAPAPKPAAKPKKKAPAKKTAAKKTASRK